MKRFTPYPLEQAFAHAEAFLAGGKSKTDRPVGSNTRLRRVDDDRIALVLHKTAVVTYHRDGTFTIYGGGWNTVTTKKRIRQYSPAHPHSDGKGGWVVGTTGELTPARVQRCRTCKGTGGEVFAVRCHPTWWSADGMRTSPRCVHGSRFAHPTGQWDSHSCYRCNGEGVVDYGSKPVPVTVDASTPYRVNASGTFLGLAEPIYAGSAYAPYAPKPSHSVGSELVRSLASVLPNITAQVVHPVTGYTFKLNDVVVNLNDSYRWTRERIADWLDTLDLDLRFPVS